MRSPIVPQSLDFGLSNSWMFRTISMDDSTLSAYLLGGEKSYESPGWIELRIDERKIEEVGLH